MERREDRISLLSDDVLCHILSLLPTHEAISTTLLSKRWQTLWHSVPALDLNDETFLQNGTPYTSFLTFAYAAILSRIPHHRPLTRLLLNCSACPTHNDLLHLKISLNAVVVQRGLQHLKIDAPRNLKLPLQLPSSAFVSKTLVVLELCRLYVYAIGSVHLPALKTLRLDDVCMWETRFLAELLRGCPVLEDFRANQVYVPRESDAAEFQSMPSLLRADVYDNHWFEIPLKAVCNVEYLRFRQKIDHEERFPVFRNLVHLELIFWRYTDWRSVFEMLKHCPKLQTFLLKLLPVEQCSREVWYCPQSVPGCISSQLRKCTILNYKDTECELLFVKYILQNSRALRTMTIHNLQHEHYLFLESLGLPFKLQKLQELAMFSRSSATCELLFK